MPEVSAAASYYYLGEGAMGIAEDHTRPDGRALAIELIKSGRVTNLFVEFAEEQFGVAMQYAWNQRGKGTDAIRQAAPNGNLFNNPIPLSTVIAKAMKRNIPVHCGDHPRMAYRPNDFRTRHTRIREVFRRITNDPNLLANTQAEGPHARGCLLLWGGNHFEGAQRLDQYILGLPYALMG